MKKAVAVVGLRVAPDTEDADWYTVWYESEEGPDRVAMIGDRVRWMFSESAARAVALERCGHDDPASVEREPVICDIAGAMQAIKNDREVSERQVLITLNLLDDFILNIAQPPELPRARVLDHLVVLLTEGEPLASAVERVGGQEAVIEPILGSLGRVLNWASFQV